MKKIKKWFSKLFCCVRFNYEELPDNELRSERSYEKHLRESRKIEHKILGSFEKVK